MITQIRAHAIKEKGGRAEPFSYERAVGSHDVLVKITHCSIARGDIQFIDDDELGGFGVRMAKKTRKRGR